MSPLGDVTRSTIEEGPDSVLHEDVRLGDVDDDGDRELFNVRDVRPGLGEPSWHASDACGTPSPCARTPALVLDPAATLGDAALGGSLMEHAQLVMEFEVDTPPTGEGTPPLVQLAFEHKQSGDAVTQPPVDVAVRYNPAHTPFWVDDSDCAPANAPSGEALLGGGLEEPWKPYQPAKPTCQFLLTPGEYDIAWSFGDGQPATGEAPEHTGYDQRWLIDAVDLSLTGNGPLPG